MKSERRHKLEKNELADHLAEFINKVKPYQNVILGVAILAALITVGYVLSARHKKVKTAAGWNQFYKAFAEDEPDPVAFDHISKEHPNTDLGHWSTAIAGDLYLSSGCGDLFLNKADANEALRQASERYRDLLSECRQPMLKARATFGLARTFEAQGDLKKAIGRYEEVVHNWPEGTYAAPAAQRLKDLARPEVKEWYDKFDEFDPQEALASTPGVPGKRPEFNPDTLLEPLFSPKFDLGEKKETGKRPEPLMPSLDPEAEDDEPFGAAPKDGAGEPPAEPTDEPSPPAPPEEKKDAAPPVSSE